jgi:hypothetical protein
VNLTLRCEYSCVGVSWPLTGTIILAILH